MRVLLFFLLSAFPFLLKAQSIDQHTRLLKDGKKEDAYAMAVQLLKTDSTKAYALFALGSYYRRAHLCDTAYTFLNNAILIDGDSTWISGWAHALLGSCYIQNGFKQQGLHELHATMNMATSMSAADFAERQIDSVEQRTALSAALNGYPKWIVVEGKNITFKFQDTVGWSRFMPAFIQRHERAYLVSDSFFRPALPKKISLQVWKSRTQARQLLGSPVGFADPEACLCNIHLYQSSGHELTHVLSYWAWGRKQVSRNRLINEGIAANFDGNSADKYEEARKAVKGKNIAGVMEIWQNDRSSSEDVVYPVGGAFINFLIAHSTGNEFQELVRKQTIEDARKIYGKEKFDDLIKNFDTLIGFK